MLPGCVPWPEELARIYRAKGHWLDRAIPDFFAELAAARPDQVAVIDGARRNKNLMEETTRVTQLLRRPVGQYVDLLGQVDAQTGEIVPALRNHEGQIEYIRKVRDELHIAFKDWDEIIDYWEGYTVESGDEPGGLVAFTYRFAAAKFLTTDKWELKINKPPAAPPGKKKKVLKW
ncbi:MAG: hypothetical protein FJX47_14430 [Alphaproteobacteria bacterium]|nr:hypothetical protein [Alphaproteobacteria bacterium]